MVWKNELKNNLWMDFFASLSTSSCNEVRILCCILMLIALCSSTVESSDFQYSWSRAHPTIKLKAYGFGINKHVYIPSTLHKKIWQQWKTHLIHLQSYYKTKLNDFKVVLRFSLMLCSWKKAPIRIQFQASVKF